MRVVDLAAKGSFAWQHSDLRTLPAARGSNRLVKPTGVVVITHGTDAMEELVFLLGSEAGTTKGVQA